MGLENSIGTFTLEDQLEVFEDNSYDYDTNGYLHVKITQNSVTTYHYDTMGELKEVAIVKTTK
jgi:hypothetical protein